VINKGLDGELVASKILSRSKKRRGGFRVLPTFEIKEVETMIPACVIKLEQVEEEEVMQKKTKLNGIPKLV
jgi:hypothetical protein